MSDPFVLRRSVDLVEPGTSVVSSPLVVDHNCALLLDELLDDCFQLSVDGTYLCSTRAEYARKFEKYLTDLHNQENLAFVIEVFRYEYFYDKIYDGRNPGLLTSPPLNTSANRFEHMPFPFKPLSRLSSLKRTNLLASSAKIFTFIDEPQEVWDKFKDLTVSDDSSLESAVAMDTDGIVADQWQYIIARFLTANAPDQINLCKKTVQDIMDDDAENDMHHPAVLLQAKTDVVQLLRENAYGLFLKSQKHSLPTQECPCGGVCDSDIKPVTSAASSVASTTQRNLASPVPLARRKPKFLHHISSSHNPSESSGSATSLSSFMSHFKPHYESPTPRKPMSAPQSHPVSALHSQNASPLFMLEEEIRRSTSTTGAHVPPPSPSILGKLFKRKKSP